MSDAAQELAVFLPANRTAFAPGEVITVTTLWALAQPPGQLELRLFWVTRGKGTEDLEIVARHAVPAPAAAGEFTWTLELPGAPWSFSGKLISLVWGVEVVATSPACAARCEFVLAPDQAEVLLHASSAAREPSTH